MTVKEPCEENYHVFSRIIHHALTLTRHMHDPREAIIVMIDDLLLDAGYNNIQVYQYFIDTDHLNSKYQEDFYTVEFKNIAYMATQFHPELKWR